MNEVDWNAVVGQCASNYVRHAQASAPGAILALLREQLHSYVQGARSAHARLAADVTALSDFALSHQPDTAEFQPSRLKLEHREESARSTPAPLSRNSHANHFCGRSGYTRYYRNQLEQGRA